MSALINLIWWISAVLFLGYVFVCILCIYILEKRVKEQLEQLALALENLLAVVDKKECLQDLNVEFLFSKYAQISSLSCESSKAFDYFSKRELFESAANDYNEAVLKYNGLVDGFGSCVVARVIGKARTRLFDSKLTDKTDRKDMN